MNEVQKILGYAEMILFPILQIGTALLLLRKEPGKITRWMFACACGPALVSVYFLGYKALELPPPQVIRPLMIFDLITEFGFFAMLLAYLLQRRAQAKHLAQLESILAIRDEETSRS